MKTAAARILLTTVCVYPLALQMRGSLFFEFGGGRLLLSDLFLLVGIWFVTIVVVYRNGDIPFTNKVLLGLGILASIQGFSAFVGSGQITAVLRMSTQYIVCAALVTLRLSFWESEKLLSWFVRLLMIVPATVVLEGCADQLGYSIGITWFGNIEGTSRYVGIAGDTAQASMVSLLLTLIYGVRLVDSMPRVRPGVLAAVVTSGLGNLLTGTRGSLVCLVAGILFLAIRLHRRTRFSPRTRLTAIAVLAGVVLFLGVFAAGTLNRFTQTENAGVASRVIPTALALKASVESPLWGIGFGNAYTVLRGAGYGDQLGYVGAFNQYLHVLLETGIVGLVAFGAFLFLVVRLMRTLSVLSGWWSSSIVGFRIWTLILLIVYQTEVWMSPGSLISLVWFAGLGLMVCIMQSQTSMIANGQSRMISRDAQGARLC